MVIKEGVSIKIMGDNETSTDPGELVTILERQLKVPGSKGIGFTNEEIPMLIEALRLLDTHRKEIRMLQSITEWKD